MAKRIVDYHGYPVDPIDTSNDAVWFYVQKEGLVIAGKGIQQSIIPWRKVLRAVDDHGKAKSRRPSVLAKEDGNAKA